MAYRLYLTVRPTPAEEEILSLRRFLEEGLVNEWMQSISPMVGAGPDYVVPGDFLPQEFIFQREQMIECERDIIIRGRLG